MKKFFWGVGADVIGSLLLAVGIFCFSEKIDIAPGGASGAAIMIKYMRRRLWTTKNKSFSAEFSLRAK